MAKKKYQSDQKKTITIMICFMYGQEKIVNKSHDYEV